MARLNRINKGRRKIEMKKMPNESNLQVTFSKRRNGLFKKASELTTLCGAEVALIVFSPGNKAYSFGHPNVEELMERHLNGNAPPAGSSRQLIEASRNLRNQQLNMQLTEILDAIDEAKKHGVEINRIRKESRATNPYDRPPEQLTQELLLQLQPRLEMMKNVISKGLEQLDIQQLMMPPVPPQQHQLYMGDPGASSSSSVPPAPYYEYPTMNMLVDNNNNDNAGFIPNMNPDFFQNQNMNPGFVQNPHMNWNQVSLDADQLNGQQQGMMQPQPPSSTGFNNPGFGSRFY